MVSVVVEDAEVEVGTYEATGARRGAKRWWRKREGIIDEDGDALRQSSRKKVDRC